jgi:hypothetical protein
VTGVILLLIIAAGLASYSSTNNNSSQTNPLASISIASTQPFQDVQYGFGIEVPVNWTVHNAIGIGPANPSGIIDVLTVTAPTNVFSSSFVVSVDPSPGTNSPSQYYQLYKSKVVQDNQGNGATFQLGANVTLGGLPAFDVSYTVHIPVGTQNYDCPEKDYVAIECSMAYIVSFSMCNVSGQPSTFSDFLTEFDYFASGFTFF